MRPAGLAHMSRCGIASTIGYRCGNERNSDPPAVMM